LPQTGNAILEVTNLSPVASNFTRCVQHYLAGDNERVTGSAIFSEAKDEVEGCEQCRALLRAGLPERYKKSEIYLATGQLSPAAAG
jgi:hypothetical protein